MVRYAEDAAIVMQAIAKPDGRDMSVSDIPFNWNATMDIKKLRVGYIKESFDNITDPESKARNQKVLDVLTSRGESLSRCCGLPLNEADQDERLMTADGTDYADLKT